jgi:SAM-dependent methyltransferase
MTTHTTGAEKPAEFWEGFYRERDAVWSGRVNAVLVQEVEGLTPGSALDLGCGEGGDVLWLAAHGWTATGLDISSTAIRRGAQRAVDAGLEQSVDWRQQDLAEWVPDREYDLVSAHFLQAPVHLAIEPILSNAVRAVAPGGLLLVVSHAAVPSWRAGQHADTVFPTPEEVVAQLRLDPDRFVVETAEVRPRDVVTPDGEPATLLDSVVRVRRLATTG